MSTQYLSVRLNLDGKGIGLLTQQILQARVYLKEILVKHAVSNSLTALG